MDACRPKLINKLCFIPGSPKQSKNYRFPKNLLISSIHASIQIFRLYLFVSQQIEKPNLIMQLFIPCFTYFFSVYFLSCRFYMLKSILNTNTRKCIIKLWKKKGCQSSHLPMHHDWDQSLNYQTEEAIPKPTYLTCIIWNFTSLIFPQVIAWRIALMHFFFNEAGLFFFFLKSWRLLFNGALSFGWSAGTVTSLWPVHVWAPAHSAQFSLLFWSFTKKAIGWLS